MKILADYFLYNSKKENVEYEQNTPLAVIIKESYAFIQEVDKNINFDNLVTKWNELNKFLDKYGNIPLYKLLKIQKKYKICYGGYIKFKVIYNKTEQFILFKSNNSYNNENKNKNSLFMIYNYILKYLTNEDILNLSLINKESYNMIKNNKIFDINIYLKNNCDYEDEKEKKIINFNKFFGGPSYNLYEVKKLGMFVGKKYVYLLIQSMETYNVEIMRLNKNNIDEHEVIFRDEWTNYYMFNNIIYQLKYNKEKIKLNKIDKNEDEINFISINVSNLGDNFDSEYFYNFKENNDIYVVSSELKIYKLNHKKKKLKLFFDESKKYKLFKTFIKECKIRLYNKYYIFIQEIFFLSLKKFYIYDINNKKLINCFPKIRGVELVQKINNYYYAIDYRNIYLLSDKDFEINYQFKKYNCDFCMNQLLVVDSFLNNMQISINDYIYKEITSNENNKNEVYKKINLKNLFFKVNENYLCSDYYNDEKALYIKLLKINQINNKISNIKNNNVDAIKEIRIDMNKFIKKINFEENIKPKTKKEIIRNIKCHLFFNGLNDIVINVNEYFWIYHYNDTFDKFEDEKDNSINNQESINKINIENNSKEKVLIKYDGICIKTNEIIRHHNIIFYDNKLIVWKQKSLKIIYFNLDKKNLCKIKNKDKDKDKNNEKKNKNVKILCLEDIEDENNDIYVETPIFLFNSYNALFLISSFSEENKSYDLFEIKIENDKIILVKNYTIEMNKKEKNKDNEILMYAKFIYDKSVLVIFTSYSIYLFKIDNNDEDNIYREIKRKEHYIIGYFIVRQLNEEESCFIAQDDRTKKCLFFDVNTWLHSS